MLATLLRPTKAEPSIEKRKSLPALHSLVLNADYRPSTYQLSIIAAARDAVSAIWRERFDCRRDLAGCVLPLPIDGDLT
jgi:hypothetical protein